MEMKNKYKLLIAAFLAGLTFFLLREDSMAFLSWWAVIWILGCTFMPLTGMLFSGFQDKGWLFSKVLAVAICGYATWVLVTCGILKFTRAVCIGVTLVCIAANVWLMLWQRGRKRCAFPVKESGLIFLEECVLFAAFLLWTYIAGFRPAAHGTEKFMDYGFMAAMMRSTELPFTDIWYGTEPVNYYYGGQYYAVFLTKLTWTQVASAYNLMRTLIAAMAFALPFSLVRQISADYYGKPGRRPVWSGMLAGMAVSLAGNMHYIIYGKLIPLLEPSVEAYWFPNSTRYIGHNPDSGIDRTIHEFPSYSFILGDLHAHVVNIFFVLTVLGLLYTWAKSEKYDRKKTLVQFPLLMCGVLLGIFHWSNTWDFAIYYVVVCGVCFFCNLARFQTWKKGFGVSLAQWIEMLLLSFVIALPFALRFDSGMVQGVRLVKHSSAFYQFCVLWALPVIIVICYLIRLCQEQRKCNVLQWLARTKRQDIFIAVLCLCAVGLIILPEIIYVKDIYEETAPRSNTMFKLTYQAFILFGISMGYILVRFLTDKSCRWIRGAGIRGLICVLLTSGYTFTAVRQWYGEVWKREGYSGLDATAFLETDFSQDAAAIRWLQSNIEGTPIVLEAHGDSYTDYCRVSAMTGLPTVLGWYVHEWLWRGDTDDLNEKRTQIDTIYTSMDETQVSALLEEYDVEYIFIGQMEREKYPALNEALLKSLGHVVFEGEALVIQLDRS